VASFFAAASVDLCEVRCVAGLASHGPPGVLRIEEVERPVPGDWLLVRVRAITASRLDCHARD
jgi:hypothetical protein